jgi:hypothetical protein
MPILGVIDSAKTGRLSNPAYDFIAKYTGGGSSFSFTGIDQSYKHLELRINYFAASVTDVGIQFNGNSGYKKFYTEHRTPGSTGNSGGFSNSNSQGIDYGNGMWQTGQPLIGRMIITDYTNTNKLRAFFNEGGQLNGAGNTSARWNVAAVFNTTAALTTIRIATTGGANFTGATVFALYGIKG